MNFQSSLLSAWRTAPMLVPLLLLSAAMPSPAQYKLVGTDGKVTYTDRAPDAPDGRSKAVALQAPPAPVEETLPFELRQVANRYPVTLYALSSHCEPCESARSLLRLRGIPYSEKQVTNAEDSQALEKIAGGRETPTLAIGSQVVRGMSPDLWNAYLDAAGYPRVSKLPTGYQNRAPAPMVERREDATAPAPTPAARVALQAAPRAPAQVAAGGIRF